MTVLPDPAFWAGRRVLLTGHTGFKGSWAALWLSMLGAHVIGMALPSDTDPAPGSLLGVLGTIDEHLVDLRDRDAVDGAIRSLRPDIVLHMAAQALVRRSIRDPATTWATNVMGTLNLLEALLAHDIPAPVLVVTSDKVYRNDDSGRAFSEEDRLGGKDPYSTSKAACELLVASHRATWFQPRGIPLATVRGGNVIGGGDFSEDRIVPDIVRALRDDREVVLRHPEATRPWQHVLDCLCGYLVYLECLSRDPKTPATLNIGPDFSQEITVGEAVGILGNLLGGRLAWRHQEVPASIEARALRLDSRRARVLLGWENRLSSRTALSWTAEWYAAWLRKEDVERLGTQQISRFEALTGRTVAK